MLCVLHICPQKRALNIPILFSWVIYTTILNDLWCMCAFFCYSMTFQMNILTPVNFSLAQEKENMTTDRLHTLYMEWMVIWVDRYARALAKIILMKFPDNNPNPPDGKKDKKGTFKHQHIIPSFVAMLQLTQKCTQ